jgi:ABC-type protease/lipase transport system fused ATPase/permease subunit
MLTLIYQLINSLLQGQESNSSILPLPKSLQSISPLMLLVSITLTVSVKLLLQFLISIMINSIIAKRESSVSSALFKATLEENLEERKNRDSVESLVLFDTYAVRVFSIVKTFPKFVSYLTTILVIFVGLLFYSAKDSMVLILVLSVVSIVTFSYYTKLQKAMSSKLIDDERMSSTIRIESQRLATELLLGNRIEDTIGELQFFYTRYKTTMGKITIYGEIPRYVLEIALVSSLALTYQVNHSQSFLSALALLALKVQMPFLITNTL